MYTANFKYEGKLYGIGFYETIEETLMKLEEKLEGFDKDLIQEVTVDLICGKIIKKLNIPAVVKIYQKGELPIISVTFNKYKIEVITLTLLLLDQLCND